MKNGSKARLVGAEFEARKRLRAVDAKLAALEAEKVRLISEIAELRRLKGAA